MFRKFQNLWNDYGFEIVLIGSIIFLLLYGFTRRNHVGTYSTSFYYSPLKVKNNPNQSTCKVESKGEQRCREVLENYFSKPFPNRRPNFMNNPITAQNLEIDCYNDELRLGVEYHGKQHFEFVPYFHKTKDKFSLQQYRDEIKRRLCRDNGIILIEVPYTVPIEEIESFIMNKLRQIL